MAKQIFSKPIKVGASYYPEVLPEKDWATDLDTARDLGLSVLRCGEFAWSSLISPEGKSTMEWVHRFLDAAAARGHDVVWCTPSATPPPHLFDRWPDLYATNWDGVQMQVGIRRHYCPSHPGYLDLCAEVAGRLVREFGSHPSIRGWQVDNELAGDGFTCWCPRCGEAFQKWLEERYESLDRLNEVWQTSVWSQVYTHWGQIPIPRRPAHAHTPALRLAWRRFRSDCWLNFYRRQADALREGGATCVTTNFYNMTWDLPFDRWKWRDYMEVVGVSHYVEDRIDNSFELAVLMGPEPGEKPIWALEQKAGQQVSQNLQPDDVTRLERHLTWCAEAGVECGVYWHLRQHAAGCEMEHGAVLRHDGRPMRIARAVHDAIEISHTKQTNYPATGRLLVFSFHQFWANENRPPMGSVYDYRVEVQQNWFDAATDLPGRICVGNHTAVRPGLSVIVAPFFQLDEPGAASAFKNAVETGSTLITTLDFLRLDNENNVRRIAPLGGIAAWVKIPEIEVYQFKADSKVVGEINGQATSGRYFWGVPKPEDLAAEAILSIGLGKFGDLEGPLAIEFTLGKGKLIVALTALDMAGVRALLT